MTTKKQKQATPKNVWAVFQVRRFDELSTSGIRLRPGIGFPTCFLPVFETYDAALVFAGGDASLIEEMESFIRNDKNEK